MRLVKKLLFRVLFYFASVLLGLFFVLPLLWLFVTPFRSDPSLAVRLPANPTLQNFIKVVNNAYAMRAFANSAIQALGSTFLVVMLAALAAYALSRVDLPGKGIIVYILILFSSVVTGIAAMVPLFFLLLQLGLIDTHLGIVLAFSGGFLPTGIFLMKDFVDSVSLTYEESAVVSGASKVQIFKDIILPLIGPGMVVVAVFTFAQIWSNFLLPFILLRSNSKMPVSVAIYTFTNEIGMPKIGLISAYSLLYVVPIISLYIFTNRRYGFKFYGGIKG
ncbi:carbohydrate ABC transporter permease [Candidatus Bipolaricaulota bacterium]|nr:carbohydrate ABC transporter permease [Candidatus Bipolaricaulota bacterium]